MTTGFGFCANCGTPRIGADQKFCAVCGSVLAQVTPPAPAPAEAPAEPPAPVPAQAEALTEAQVEPRVAPLEAPPAPVVTAAQFQAVPPPPAPTFAAPPALPPSPTFAAPPAAAPAGPPAWSMPPAQPPAPTFAAPPAPTTAWPGQPAEQYPSGYPGAPAPVAPVTPAAATTGFKITPPMLLIGAVVLAVIVGAYLFMNMGSKSTSITFTPSTLSCSTPVTFTTTAHLPSSVHTGDTITITLDGKSAGSSQISAGDSEVTQQPDGSWNVVSTTSPSSMQTLCAAGGSAGGFNILTPGTHTMQMLDASGKVLAQGSYTVTP